MQYRSCGSCTRRLCRYCAIAVTSEDVRGLLSSRCESSACRVTRASYQRIRKILRTACVGDLAYSARSVWALDCLSGSFLFNRDRPFVHVGSFVLCQHQKMYLCVCIRSCYLFVRWCSVRLPPSISSCASCRSPQNHVGPYSYQRYGGCCWSAQRQ